MSIFYCHLFRELSRRDFFEVLETRKKGKGGAVESNLKAESRKEGLEREIGQALEE
ncbi:MAG: hypothetical protein V1816_20935 [Pseudomonadota bacterium]